MGYFSFHADPGSIGTAYEQLDRSQWLKPAEIESLQLKKLNILLAHCFEQSPYYRKVLQSIDFPARPIQSLEDFRRLPLLTRELYRANFEQIKAKSLPPGMIASEKGSFTSGTNGVPIQVLKTNFDQLWWNACYLRDLEWNNIDPRGRLASVRLIAMTKDQWPAAMAGTSLPYWRKSFQSFLLTGSSFGMDIRQDPRRQLAWLRQIKPDYLISMPTNLEFLAGLIKESGQPLAGLRMIQAMGETVDSESRQRIEGGFGVPVKNLYSSTEAGYVASPCPSGNGLHVHAENVLTEVLDEQNRPCAPGQIGRLVFTSLHNFAAPFIRYDILDEVTLADAPCPCGRGLPLWKHIEGRRFPLFQNPTGGHTSTVGMVREVRLVGGFHQFQIVQRAIDRVIVRVVPDQTWQAERVPRICAAVQNEFPCTMRVEVEEKAFLERPAGGKLKLVVIEMDRV